MTDPLIVYLVEENQSYTCARDYGTFSSEALAQIRVSDVLDADSSVSPDDLFIVPIVVDAELPTPRDTACYDVTVYAYHRRDELSVRSERYADDREDLHEPYMDANAPSPYRLIRIVTRAANRLEAERKAVAAFDAHYGSRDDDE